MESSNRDKKYPYDPDMITSSMKLGTLLGTLMMERALDEFTSENIQNICFINKIDVSKLDTKHVFNWIFQGVADVLRNPQTYQEIQRMITDAK